MPRRRRRGVARRRRAAARRCAAVVPERELGGAAMTRCRRPSTRSAPARAGDPQRPSGRPASRCGRWPRAAASASRSSAPSSGACRCRRSPRSTASPRRSSVGAVDAAARRAGTATCSVIRADEGPLVPSSERPDSAVGRVVFSDDGQGLEVYEYVADADRRPRRLVRPRRPQGAAPHRRAGCASSSSGRDDVHLAPGDCLVHAGPHPAPLEHRGRRAGAPVPRGAPRPGLITRSRSGGGHASRCCANAQSSRPRRRAAAFSTARRAWVRVLSAAGRDVAPSATACCRRSNETSSISATTASSWSARSP